MPSSAPLKIVLISPYDLGRQPFELAHPAAWLRQAGFEVACVDLSQERLSDEALDGVGLVAVHLGMHTATRIALELVAKVRALRPQAHLCAYGLYAPMNAALLREVGFGTLLGGEVEPGLLHLARRLAEGDDGPQREPLIELSRIEHRVPDRSTLKPLSRHAALILPGGARKVVGHVQASRGCKHLCRHCPVVPVYGGRFRIAPVDVVMADLDQQIQAGAEHISFGDPDFLNGPGHALRIIRALRAAHPGMTWDAVIKIEHLLERAELLPELAASGCLFVTSAVESVDEATLLAFEKGHTGADFARASRLMREAGIALSPTFVPFTPWTTLRGYVELLEAVCALDLVEAVAPVQLCIRLLVPEGSRLLDLEGFRSLIGGFDPALLGYPWRNPEPGVDALQVEIQSLVEAMEGESRRATFEAIWARAHAALGQAAPLLAPSSAEEIPRMSEPWYCCAEPTQAQLTAL